MRLPLAALTVLLAVLLQSTLLGGLRLADGPLDLPLLLVIAWAVAGGAEEGLLWALLAGLATDLVSAAPFGVSALALVATVLAVRLLAGSTFTNSTFLPVIAGFVGTLAHGVVLALVVQIAGWSMPWLPTLADVILPSAILNALLITPLYWIVSAIVRRSQPILGFG